MSDFRTGRHVVHRLNAHLVLTTKYRRDAIRTDRVRDLLKGVMTSVAADMGATVEAVEADGDHIHLLVSYPPQIALSKLVGSLKGVSARRLRQQGWQEVRRVLWGDNFWSPSGRVVSCGAAPLEVVRTYVETQADPDLARIGQKMRAVRKRRRQEKKEDA
jgi:putative transposase